VVLLAAGIVAATPAVSAAGPGGTTRVYTASNTALIVLDAATNTVTNQVPLGFQPALRVRPDGTQVYLSDSSGGTIRVLATATNTIVATIGVGGQPSRPAFTPDSRRAYVANPGARGVQVIDTSTRQVVRVIPVSGSTLYPPEVSPDGTKVYLTRDTGSGSDLVVIRTATDTVSRTVALPAATVPHDHLVFAPNGRLAMVRPGNVIDVTTDTLVRTIALGSPWIRDFVFTADSTGVYAADTCRMSFRGAIQHIDVTTGTVIRSLIVGRRPLYLEPTPDLTRLYAVIDGGRNLAVVNPTTGTIEDEFGVTDPTTPTRLRDLDLSGAAPPATRPGTRFAPAAPTALLCEI
jgi:YVTN family beta-propeller protein